MVVQTFIGGVPEYRCSFCGKDRNEVAQLIAGPKGVYICNECVDLCRAILDEGSVPVTVQKQPRPTTRALPFTDERFIAACKRRGITIEARDNGFAVTYPKLVATPDALQAMLREVQQEIEKDANGEDAEG